MPDGDRRSRVPAGRSRTRADGGWSSRSATSADTPTERLIHCPDCKAEYAERDLAQHLIVAHDYLPVSGTLLPRDAALSFLWERAFSTGDLPAHAQLLRLLAEDDASRYVAALEAELQARASSLLSQKPQHFARIVQNLRNDARALQHFPKLLLAADPRVRQFGRELLLPDAGRALADPQTPVAAVQRRLDQLCPREDIWTKIRVCQRLPRFGAAAEPTKACLHELQGQRPVACPECGAAVQQNELEVHLRRSHQINQFRGERRSLPDTIAALVKAVSSTDPDAAAWEILEAIAEDEAGAQAGAFMAHHMKGGLETVREEDQQDVLPAVADVIATGTHRSSMLLAMAEKRDRWARKLALVLVERLPQPLDQEVVRAILPLLARKRAPRPLQVAAATALLHTAGREGASAQKVVQALISRCGKARALDRLGRLEQFVGPAPVIAERRAYLESRLRMRCPRCQVQLRRPDMETHLWTEHGLVLDGRRVREPWGLMRAWLDHYRRTGDAQLLARCRSLAQQLDSDQGLQRVHRLMMVSGVGDIEARQVLLAKAKQRGQSLCPHCYALVNIPEEVLPRTLNQSHGRLSMGGYCVHVSETGLVPRLTMETSNQVIYRGREPAYWLTRQGAVFLFAGLPAAAALAFAVLFHYWKQDSVLPAGLSVLALVVYFIVRARGWQRPQPVDRAVDYAWTLFAPRLHAQGFAFEDSAFLAGLALSSLRHGRSDIRADKLKRLIQYTENSLAGENRPSAHLAALKRLEVTDEAAAGTDPVFLVAAAVARCFTKGRPLTFAQHLLGEWEGSWWTAGNLARLRVLLCDRAFEAGLEVLDLVEAGHSAPALAAVLRTESVDSLAKLRLLWSLRPRKPWARWSDPVTVFELANSAEPGRKLLAKYPDLLLMDEHVASMFICTQGIVFQDVTFSELPRKIEMRSKKDFDRTEYEIVLGTHRFPLPDGPGEGIGRLEYWFRYYFQEFLPQVEAVYSWQSPAGTRPVQFQEAVKCPECGQPLIAVRGNVGSAQGAK